MLKARAGCIYGCLARTILEDETGREYKTKSPSPLREHKLSSRSSQRNSPDNYKALYSHHRHNLPTTTSLAMYFSSPLILALATAGQLVSAALPKANEYQSGDW